MKVNNKKNKVNQIEPVLEPNKKVQLDFAGPLPVELTRDAYILVAIDTRLKLPTAKAVSNNTEQRDTIKIGEKHFKNALIK